MHLERYTDAASFYQRAEPFLLAHEAEHNLQLGICTTLLRQPEVYPLPPYLGVVEEDGEIITVALRTPPHNLILSLIPRTDRAPEALALLARDVAQDHPDLPGVLGPSAWSEALAHRQGMRERIYALTAVRPPAGVPGQMRRATEADRALLERWLAAFAAEALRDDEPLDPREWVARALASPLRTVCLWDDGQAVSLACAGNPTPNGIRIGPVYTPPELRGRGYASACVAALSQQMLDSGRRFCFLFTDLANPTSNHIYQTIGYEPVSDVALYRFERGAIASA
jgi:predicted GNAT family acetyltransferase